MTEKKSSRFRRFKEVLRSKYRLILLNDTSFAEKFSIRLTPINLIIGLAALTIIMTSAVIALVAFTSLREYIPGYGTIAERKQILILSSRADTLEKQVEARDAYLKGILSAFNENVETQSNRPVKDTSGKYAKVNVEPTKADKEFRKSFEELTAGKTLDKNKSTYPILLEMLFFAPVKGIITNSFNSSEEHFGIDIATKEDEVIKSTLDGTVIFKGFTAENGNIIHIQHSNNVVSIYKHCSIILKDIGNKVKSGEAIAVVGNTGENSRGNHLHFELWFNGISVNPQDFVAF